ncbi:MAG TPA: deoxyguanosinetriphosphate triphosphohydrolase [Hyphomonas atlantica]|uniref:Deoxyguanosinetriphosphate triphosphohydrolase-like protein n=1 Tax=Hyphomonas atlantica TaxID=1280948 RepID=A0A3B9L2E0_9PROT|nr:deoxyguanosinetriphosphate triphosphohydrolase [Hyphomonas atlantica]HAE95068.1 deoxyguanosinetriphosphate triphosphohydrolase [Hyphomonas atlantica]HBH44756.1 deoxyguanosinetriphosphate triphosphohydrolase [Hyphomonas atlantica]
MEKRAVFATRHEDSRGRYHEEAPSATRTPFQRDRDRIIHSTAFRRLKQKTQVFVAHEGDHFRTRLTHSLEVAQIARSISRTLGLDEDLAEALALAHDIGHPPFGHAGEDQLDECMADYQGFDHNAQTLRVVTKLEVRYPNFEGLNLTWELLEGLVKHNGPMVTRDAPMESLPAAFRQYANFMDLEPHQFAGPEAQVAALSDDIAYNNHDIDDGIAAGLFTVDDLMDLPIVGDVFRSVKLEYPHLKDRMVSYEAVRRLIGLWINDLTSETERRIKEYAPKSAADVRAMDVPLVAFSEELESRQRALRAFLHERMYKHYTVNRMRSKAKRMLAELFDIFLKEPDTLPSLWRLDASQADEARRARIVCDYIAGMTDTYAIEEHRRLYHPDVLR